MTPDAAAAIVLSFIIGLAFLAAAASTHDDFPRLVWVTLLVLSALFLVPAIGQIWLALVLV